MAAAPLLASVADLGTLVDEELATNDPKALLLLRVASGVVRDEVHQHFSVVAHETVRLTPRGGLVLLPEMPAFDITLLETYRTGTWSTVATDRYLIDEQAGLIEARFAPYWRWPTEAQSWRVTYSHGYEDIPDTVQGVVLGLASRAWMVPIGVENERVGERSIKYAMVSEGFLEAESNALEAYRYPRAR